LSPGSADGGDEQRVERRPAEHGLRGALHRQIDHHVDGADRVVARNCRIYGNGTTGIYASFSHDILIEHCISDHNAGYGFRTNNSQRAALRNNTFYKNVSHAVWFVGYSAAGIRNNIFVADGSGDNCLRLNATIPPSDHNLFQALNGATVAYSSSTGSYLTLADWQAGSGGDTHSLEADPLFVDADGADDIGGNADDDFHLQSTTGSWRPGGFVAEGFDSPGIDLGDPASDFTAETAPNGNRINTGAFGGTAQASRSGGARMLTLLYPHGGETLKRQATIRWVEFGGGALPADTLKVEYSSDGGSSWQFVPGGNSVSAFAGEIEWDLMGLPWGSTYRVRVTSLQDGAVVSESADFSIGGMYFVNDGATADDEFTTAIGDDLNDGKSPAAPKASVQSVIDEYDLEPGDTVFVDSGSYILTTNIVVGSDDGGSADGRVHFLGVKGKTTIDRNDAATTSTRCFSLEGTYVTVEGFTCQNAYIGIGVPADYSRVLHNVVRDCRKYGLQILDSDYGEAINNLVIHRTEGDNSDAVYIRESSSGTLPFTFKNNTVIARFGGGGGEARALNLSLSSGVQVINNILVAEGPNRHCMDVNSVSSATVSDHNLFEYSDGAIFGEIYNSEIEDLALWQSVTGRDFQSTESFPAFADEANDDFHLRSIGGRYDPTTGLLPDNPAAWVNDTLTSLGVDGGDPGDPVGDESSLNGGRVNIGAYGGTSEASRSLSDTRWLTFLNPVGGSTLSLREALRWQVGGNAWTLGETISLELSQDGTSWSPILGGQGISHEAGQIWWDSQLVANAWGYRIRAKRDADGLVVGETSGLFAVGNYGGGDWDLYVAPGGSDEPGFGTMLQPFATPQYALEIADAVPGGEANIRVAEGTYLGTVELESWVNLMGGFSAADWARQIANHPTILDGEDSDSVVVGADNALVEGFTIQNGNANRGGGVRCEGVSPVIRYNRILNNSASYGAGVSADQNSVATLIGNIIANNDATYGDGIYLNTASILLANSTVADNQGSGVYRVNSGTPVIVNSILWNNGDDLRSVTATYSTIEDNDAGVGNIHLDPQLDANYRLMASSPCIDLGDSTIVHPDWLDVDGNPRINHSRVDMGAYESPAIGDADGNGIPNWWQQEKLGAVTGVDAQSDDDGDTVKLLAEYGFNLAPNKADLQPLSEGVPGVPVIDVMEITGQKYLTLEFLRRTDAPHLDYLPVVSDDVINWDRTQSEIAPVGLPAPSGDGVTERVKVRHTVPIGPVPGGAFLNLEISTN